ncbi:MAG TPA: hypothetical protein PLC43_04705 [Caldisericia bacterium]|nr:hypothetical protein [Caldisericia bacterium]
MENLDRLCNEYGHKLAEEVSKAEKFDAKKAETLLTKALAVLQEQGLYAFALFCNSRGKAEESGAEEIKKISTYLLYDCKVGLNGNNDLLQEIINRLASNLDDYKLAIQLLEKSLIYARYHVKALSNSLEETKDREEAK